MMMNIAPNAQNLQEILERNIDGFGYELIYLELSGRANTRSRVLRLYIDAPGGVALDDCVFVSRQIGRLLDVENLVSGQYTLEVSSPGIERPLAKPEHFEKVIGERIEVATRVKSNGRRNFLGTLLRVSDGSVAVEVDGEAFDIDVENIRRARLKPNMDEID